MFRTALRKDVYYYLEIYYDNRLVVGKGYDHPPTEDEINAALAVTEAMLPSNEGGAERDGVGEVPQSA